MAETIPSTDADSGSSYRRTRRTVTPSSCSRSRSDSWVAKKSCSEVTTSSPGARLRRAYVSATPIVVESVSAIWSGLTSR